MLRVLWAHLEDAKGAVGPSGAWWQPPERFRIAKFSNQAFWCPITKNPLFSMAQLLDPWIPNAKGAKGSVGPLREEVGGREDVGRKF
mgnify:CR=1 FL=1